MHVLKKLKSAKTMTKHPLIEDGYFQDPPESKCPHCGETGKICSYVNSINRAWGRTACEKKIKSMKM